MTGYIRQKHKVAIGEKRVGAALSMVSPRYTAQRRTSTTRAVNPIPYRADYFGHKLHIDQNEKLVMYGVTHVTAIDGHSRFAVAGTTMPVKNNLKIYRKIYKYGFYLLSFALANIFASALANIALLHIALLHIYAHLLHYCKFMH